MTTIYTTYSRYITVDAVSVWYTEWEQLSVHHGLYGLTVLAPVHQTVSLRARRAGVPRRTAELVKRCGSTDGVRQVSTAVGQQCTEG